MSKLKVPLGKLTVGQKIRFKILGTMPAKPSIITVTEYGVKPGNSAKKNCRNLSKVMKAASKRMANYP